MTYERLWPRLMEFLNEWSSAVETELGRILVTLQDEESSAGAIEIYMTREQWDDMVTGPWGDFQAAAQEVRRSVLGLNQNERFLVYRNYELVPSATPDLRAAPEETDRLGPAGERQFHWSATEAQEPEDREPRP